MSTVSTYSSSNFDCTNAFPPSSEERALFHIVSGSLGGARPLNLPPQIVQSLREKVPELLRLGGPQAPRAIILVTAHWSERRPTISSGKKHRLEYDYYGFPPESYTIKYNAPGSPEVAEEVAQAMRTAGLEPELDDFRGEW